MEQGKICFLSSAVCLAEACSADTTAAVGLPKWAIRSKSIYVYGFENTDTCLRLLQRLTGDRDAAIRRHLTSRAVVSVSGRFAEMCGPMSGLEVAVNLRDDDAVFDIRPGAEEFHSIITANGRDVFVRMTFEGVCFCLNACPEIVDLASLSPAPFDVKKHFCAAVPLAMFVRWALTDARLSAEIDGCVIVDDPLLKSRYGFLRFHKALALMDCYNFTTSLAFIPWNWRRTERATVRLFAERPDRLSLSVHGCDHTANEFNERSTLTLTRRIQTALDRMERLRNQTSLPYDRIMVFPQGVFSPETGHALKVNGFWASVNTEVSPLESSENRTTIGDLWDIAIMKYGTFPVFTRRYLTHGIENFAFDGLLGKPCLIVTHHDGFKGSELFDLISKLNGLSWTLRWRSLGEVIMRSVRTETRSNGTHVARMYGTRALLANESGEPRETAVVKEESDPDSVNAVIVNSSAVDWSHGDGQLHFRTKVSAEGTADVRTEYAERLNLPSFAADGAHRRLKTALRRYFSEFRDNYVSLISSARN
jgi:hypothetical protein